MSSVRNRRACREPQQQSEQQDLLTLLQEEHQLLLATNTGVRLACTMAAMLSPFAIFLCWAEKESRVIRMFAVQSVALLVLHLLCAGLLAMVCLLVGGIPYLGYLLTFAGWLLYFVALIVALYLRIKLMERAWHGRKLDLPLLEKHIRKYY